MAAADARPRTTSRWVSGALGLVALGIGLYVMVRPFSSLSLLVLLIAAGMVVIGASRLGGADDSPSGLARLAGVAWVAGGVAVAVWPGLTVRTLVWVVGIWLVMDGLVDVVAGFRGGTDERLASIIRGTATAVFGVLALIWPDITLLVVAVVFAARLVLFGISHIWNALRGRDTAGDENTEPRRPRRWARVAGALLALLLALALAGVSSRLRGGEPVVDGFYTAPTEVPAEPGVLLRVEPFMRGIPDGADAWRILYTTTRDEGLPAVASALVVVPSGVPEPATIAWAHGTTGVDETCAPSVLEATLETGAFFSLDRVLEEGWALVATDYVGLGTEGPHPYLIGQGEARSVLDAVRAARQMDEVTIGDDTVVWGHSQGGNAALWTGAIAEDYAPDVGVLGVAALAPASDLAGLVSNLPDVTGGDIFAAYTASAYGDIYPDIDLDDYVAPGGRVTIEQVADRCLAEPAVFSSVLSSLAVGWSIFTGDLTAGAFGDRLAENTPPFTIRSPLLLGQGAADSLVVQESQDAYVEAMCAAGQDVDYRVYEGRDHVPLVEPDSPLIPELVEWTHARLVGEAGESTCPPRP